MSHLNLTHVNCLNYINLYPLKVYNRIINQNISVLLWSKMVLFGLECLQLSLDMPFIATVGGGVYQGTTIWGKLPRMIWR